MSEIVYTAQERLGLWALGAVGFVVLNGAFVSTARGAAGGAGSPPGG